MLTRNEHSSILRYGTAVLSVTGQFSHERPDPPVQRRAGALSTARRWRRTHHAAPLVITNRESCCADCASPGHGCVATANTHTPNLLDWRAQPLAKKCEPDEQRKMRKRE